MPRGDTLWQRLEAATEPELRKLGDIVGLADTAVKPRDVLVEETSAGLRSAAGHSILNLFRGPHEFPYKQVLIDVADKMAPGWTPWSWTDYHLNDGHPEVEVEETIWGFFEEAMERKIRKLPAEAREKLRTETAAELRRLGYSEALVSQIGAGLVGAGAGALVGPALAYQVALSTTSGLAWLKLWWVGQATAAATLGAGAAVFTLLYAPVLVWWLGSPAYRKTVPATLELIKVRKLRELEKTLGPE
jgi:hypothetical protein